MRTLNRRRFVQLGGLATTALGLGAHATLAAQSPSASDDRRFD
jgi:hypothetical protein